MLRFVSLLSAVALTVNGGFFDFTEFEDPLSFFWHPKDTVSLSEKNTQCTVRQSEGTIKYGVCTHPSYCLLSGGKPHGICGILSTCCTYDRSCGKTTSAKVSYFNSGTDALTSGGCEYGIQLENNNICQIRLDFESFNLAPATLENNVPNQAYKCTSDAMVITPNTYNIPVICGKNDKQHVYVHVDPSNIKQVKLRINLASRTNTRLVEPEWRIKATQLECPNDKKFGAHINAGKDFDQLAPVGAIQYYTAKSGRIKSFGFDSTTNTDNFANGMNYAMAFKKSPTICGVKFTPKYINFGIDKAKPDTDNDCADYLFVPELSFIPPVDPSVEKLVAKVCLKVDTPTKFLSTPPGPLNIHFVSAPKHVKGKDGAGKAFDITYDLINC